MAARKNMQCKRYQEEKVREKGKEKGKKKNSEQVVKKSLKFGLLGILQTEILQIFVYSGNLSVWHKVAFSAKLKVIP